MDPDAFIRTVAYGTYVLLEASGSLSLERYHQISTDEVYGHIHGDHRSGRAMPARAAMRPAKPAT